MAADDDDLAALAALLAGPEERLLALARDDPLLLSARLASLLRATTSPRSPHARLFHDRFVRRPDVALRVLPALSDVLARDVLRVAWLVRPPRADAGGGGGREEDPADDAELRQARRAAALRLVGACLVARTPSVAAPVRAAAEDDVRRACVEAIALQRSAAVAVFVEAFQSVLLPAAPVHDVAAERLLHGAAEARCPTRTQIFLWYGGGVYVRTRRPSGDRHAAARLLLRLLRGTGSLRAAFASMSTAGETALKFARAVVLVLRFLAWTLDERHAEEQREAADLCARVAAELCAHAPAGARAAVDTLAAGWTPGACHAADVMTAVMARDTDGDARATAVLTVANARGWARALASRDVRAAERMAAALPALGRRRRLLPVDVNLELDRALVLASAASASRAMWGAVAGEASGECADRDVAFARAASSRRAYVAACARLSAAHDADGLRALYLERPVHDAAAFVAARQRVAAAVGEDEVCAITHELALDPVRVRGSASAQIFERAALLRWLREHGTHPLTRELAAPAQLQAAAKWNDPSRKRRRGGA